LTTIKAKWLDSLQFGSFLSFHSVICARRGTRGDGEALFDRGQDGRQRIAARCLPCDRDEGLADQCRMRVADGHWVESQVAIDLISASVGGASQDVS